MLATWVGILLFCGAIGKSAQFPLQVWLPDAMEGPTPVSALIHAATMVAAGVYLVARIFVLLTPGAQMFIAVIGCITLTMAALIALVQVDIKRVLAYSTLSQLGYMIFALGIGAWVAALFHLLTHAFFKSLLFLGSGQVIAGCHHEQDMRKMGGLASKMPNTALTFAIAVLAISGAGIPWTNFGIGGFYSKDEILAVAYYRHQGAQAVSHDAQNSGLPDARIVPVGLPPAQEQGEVAASNNHAGGDKLPWLLFMLPMAIAYITPFYMGRCYVLTFLGRPRDEHVHKHAHESPMMYGPLLILAAMTLVSGWYLFRESVAGAAPAATPLVAAIDGVHGVPHAIHAALASRVGFAFVVGLLGAWLIYRNGLATAERIRRMPIVRVAYTVAWNKFYFDHLYNFLLLGGTKTLAVICRLFDNWIVDGIVNASAYVTERISRFSGVVLDNMGVDGLVNGVAKVCYALGGMLRGVQTGLVRNYILVTVTMVAGLVILAALGLGETAVGIAALAVLVLWAIGLIVTSRRKPLTEKRSL
jgi:NADH-quinone oxidoreductase subunit L